jgi:hypothetical protein
MQQRRAVLNSISCHCHTIQKLKAKCNVSIIDNGGRVWVEKEETATFHTFSSTTCGCGWNLFAKRSDILDPAIAILKMELCS